MFYSFQQALNINSTDSEHFVVARTKHLRNRIWVNGRKKLLIIKQELYSFNKLT